MSAKENSTQISVAFHEVVSSKAFLVLLFAFLTGIFAQISIPVNPVPFTLQTLMVVLSGAFLGKKNGALSQLAYLSLGAVGVPVFAEASMGAAVFFGPTGGYLLAFPLAAYLTGAIIEKNKSAFSVSVAMFLGNVVVIALGTAYLFSFFLKDFNQALTYGAAIFSIWTIIKVAASTSIYLLYKKNRS